MLRNTNPQHNLRNKSQVGKYVLDSLSFGMYNHPFMVIREYIQNSVDAIDDYKRALKRKDAQEVCIDITIDGSRKSISITDNGTGVIAEKAWQVLHDLGKSEKDPSTHRGFRGIGRLGGLGYCNKLVFTTKAKNEKTLSKSTWDCNKIRSLINSSNSHDVSRIINDAVEFYQEEYLGNVKDHFFSVDMIEINGPRRLLINIPVLKLYLSQVAPVPFRSESFRFADTIDSMLRDKVNTYETYLLRVNGEVIYKPYSDCIGINDNGFDSISSVRFITLSDEEEVLAHGWIGESGLRGTIWPSSGVDGLRLRSGNILIGSKETLSELYREKRFNNYMVGEIHISDNRLIPNSRRDDFEDGGLKDNFHSCFIRDIGIPYSKLIRDLSRERSLQRKLEDANSLCNRAQSVIQRGFTSESQKQDLVDKLERLNGDKPDNWSETDLVIIINELKHSSHYFDIQNNVLPANIVDPMKFVLETIYREDDNKARAEALIEKILSNMYSST
ncbi:ATP-binding protein [Chloroflexota bacterium]